MSRPSFKLRKKNPAPVEAPEQFSIDVFLKEIQRGNPIENTKVALVDNSGKRIIEIEEHFGRKFSSKSLVNVDSDYFPLDNEELGKVFELYQEYLDQKLK